MLAATLSASLFMIKIPKKIVFLVSGSIASMSQATGMIIIKVKNTPYEIF